MGCPGSTLEKGPQRNETYQPIRGNRLETVPFQPYFGCTETSSKYCQANTSEPRDLSYVSKRACNRTLGAVLWAPLEVLGATPRGEMIAKNIRKLLFQKLQCKSGPKKPMTARDVTGFYAFFFTQKSGNVFHILGPFPF